MRFVAAFDGVCGMATSVARLLTWLQNRLLAHQGQLLPCNMSCSSSSYYSGGVVALLSLDLGLGVLTMVQQHSKSGDTLEGVWGLDMWLQ